MGSMEKEYKKDFETWNKHAQRLNSIHFEGFFHAREIWWCALGVNIGSEQDGKNNLFERPVLIIRRMRFDQLALIAPITTKIKDEDDRVCAYIMGEESQILLSQIRVVSRNRLIRRFGTLKREVFNIVLIKIATMILNNGESETPPVRRGISEPEGVVSKL